MPAIKIKAFRVETVFLIVFAISLLSGCASAVREYCKDASSPNACGAKVHLIALGCEAEAKRKTPIIKTATGNYLCDGTASQNGNSQQYRVNSTCRPEYKETQDKATRNANFQACMQAKESEGKFK